MDFWIEHILVGFSLQYVQRVNSNSLSVRRAMVMCQKIQAVSDCNNFANLYSVFCREIRHSLRVARTILSLVMFPHACELVAPSTAADGPENADAPNTLVDATAANVRRHSSGH